MTPISKEQGGKNSVEEDAQETEKHKPGKLFETKEFELENVGTPLDNRWSKSLRWDVMTHKSVSVMLTTGSQPYRQEMLWRANP